MVKKLRVAMVAPPWLSVPPVGYGGIELVLQGLITQLRKQDVEVDLFSIGDSRLKGVKVHFYFDTAQYKDIHKLHYESGPIALTQLLFSLNKILASGRYDIIHDHNGFVGPAILGWATRLPSMPPALHTYHGPPFSTKKTIALGQPDINSLFDQFDDAHRLYCVGISDVLMKNTPRKFRKHLLPPVHNGLDPQKFPFKEKKRNYYITLARFNRDKAQHVAAEICDELDLTLEMAGTVAGINTPKDLFLELANPLSYYRNFPDFRYYSDKVWPITVKNPKIRFIGNLQSTRKIRFISNAKALLFPIDWDEPFGMAILEALACGTPVIAMNRGAMPEIIQHGYNGFLAKNAKEFKEYVKRVNEIDPKNCRKSVLKNFTAEIMAKNYIDRYSQILKLDADLDK